MKIRTTLCCLLSSFLLQPSAFPQGPLPPPGAPAPTMKTLDQLDAKLNVIDTKTEKRIPVDATHTPGNPNTPNQFAITQPGSYYLPQSYDIAFPESNINIGADNVTLDLNGFTLSCSTNNPNAAITLLGPKNVLIKNGFIRSGVTVSGSTFSGFGYANGINCFAATNVTVQNVAIIGINGTGINLVGATGSTVSSCSTAITKTDGIRASNIMDCTAQQAGNDGINGVMVSRCRGETISTDTSKSGVVGTVVNGCDGVGGAGRGVTAVTATNSHGASTANNYGLFATETATNCTGTSSLGTGLSAGVATNCTGTAGGIGTGLAAEVANNCRGSSEAGEGLFSVTATGCVGRTLGTSSVQAYGIKTTNAMNCSGSAAGSGTGLSASETAHTCTGNNSGSGVGLSATIAIGCTGTSTNPSNSVVATNKYLMP